MKDCRQVLNIRNHTLNVLRNHRVCNPDSREDVVHTDLEVCCERSSVRDIFEAIEDEILPPRGICGRTTPDKIVGGTVTKYDCIKISILTPEI